MFIHKVDGDFFSVDEVRAGMNRSAQPFSQPNRSFAITKQQQEAFTNYHHRDQNLLCPFHYLSVLAQFSLTTLTLLSPFLSECQRDIHDKLMSYLHEAGVIADVVFYSTTIYDQTILEACSRVIQRLTPQIGTLERLLDILVAVS